jgi:TolA-binding protein
MDKTTQLRDKSREFQSKINEMTEYIKEIEGQVALKDAKISNLRL